MNAPIHMVFQGLLGLLSIAVFFSGCIAAQELPLGPWSRTSPMPTARSEIAAAALEGRIYVAGGIAQWGTTAAFEVYDPVSDTWQELSPLPLAVHHLAMAAVSGRVYVAGGYTDIRFSESTAEVRAYSPETRTWDRIADMPAPRAAHQMVAIDGKLFVVGGVGPRSEELWVYDPEINAWDPSRAPLPTKREHLAAAVIGGNIYVVGGRWRGVGNLATLEIYEPATDTWRRGPDMPTPRGGLTAAAVGHQVHVTGGEAFSPGRTFSQHEAYDPHSDRWTALAELPTARHGLTSAAVEARWYVIGGGTGAGAMTFISLSDLVEVFQSQRD